MFFLDCQAPKRTKKHHKRT